MKYKEVMSQHVVVGHREFDVRYLMLHQQFGDEVFRFLADIVECLVVKVVGNPRDVCKSLGVIIAHERGQTGQEDVAHDAHGPHVAGRGHRLVAYHLRTDKLWSAEKDPHIFAFF